MKFAGKRFAVCEEVSEGSVVVLDAFHDVWDAHESAAFGSDLYVLDRATNERVEAPEAY